MKPRETNKGTTKKRLAWIGGTLLVLAGIVASQIPNVGPPSYCYDDHWGELCVGAPIPSGIKYFSCYTQPGSSNPYCCKYETQNHGCQYPPPSLVKFFEYVGSYPGDCSSNSAGQWCPDMEPVLEDPGGD